MKQQMKILCAVTAFVLAAACAACNSRGDQPGGRPQTASQQPSGQETDGATTVILVNRDADAAVLEAYQEQVDTFMGEHGDIHVQRIPVYDEDRLYATLREAIATGDTPVVFENASTADLEEWARQGALLDLSAELGADTTWADSFAPGLVDLYRLDAYGTQGVYAVPCERSVDVIYYNKRLFELAGITEVPKTMHELYDAVNRLQTADIAPLAVGNRYGLERLFNNILVKRVGTQGVAELGAGRQEWTAPELVESLRLTADLKTRGALNQSFHDTAEYDTQLTRFLAGEVAMLCHSSAAVPEILRSGTDTVGEIGFFAFPYFTDKPEYEDLHVVYTSGYSIANAETPEQKAAAVKLLKYLTSEQAILGRTDSALLLSPLRNLNIPTDAGELLQSITDYANSITAPAGEYRSHQSVEVVHTGLLELLENGNAEQISIAIQDQINAAAEPV